MVLPGDLGVLPDLGHVGVVKHVQQHSVVVTVQCTLGHLCRPHDHHTDMQVRGAEEVYMKGFSQVVQLPPHSSAEGSLQSTCFNGPPVISSLGLSHPYTTDEVHPSVLTLRIGSLLHASTIVLAAAAVLA